MFITKLDLIAHCILQNKKLDLEARSCKNIIMISSVAGSGNIAWISGTMDLVTWLVYVVILSAYAKGRFHQDSET